MGVGTTGGGVGIEGGGGVAGRGKMRGMALGGAICATGEMGGGDNDCSLSSSVS
jgi:hypothetical protein